LATSKAVETIGERLKQIQLELGTNKWFNRIEPSYGHIFSSELVLTKKTDEKFLSLVDKYFDEELNDNPHLEASGVKDCKYGYAGSALPLVLEHNTPNNSVPLLWAETKGRKGHRMRPLFRRRQRHS
jgi:hypothetical protein